MAHIRRVGLTVALIVFVASIATAFALEGIGLAVIVATAAAVGIALVVPVLAIFEEERDLPAARELRRH